MSAAAGDAAARARDAATRRLAQREFARPLVVEAGAGTGKTAILVGRIAAWSLGPGWQRARERAPGAAGGALAADVWRRVVAVTFTEAAAAEMAVRVGEALRAVEGDAPPPWLDGDALPPPGEERRGRARALLGALDQLEVRTIHAFCRRLLAEHPLEAGLHPHFAVDADESQQKAIAREVLEDALPALLRESDDLLRLAAAGVGPPELEEALLGLLREGVPASALADDPLGPERLAELRDGLLADLDRFLAVEAGRLAALGGRAPKAAAAAQRLRALREPVAALAAPADLEALRDWLGEGGGELERVGEWARGSFGKSGEGRLGEDGPALAEAARRLQRWLRHLAALDPGRLDSGRRLLQPLLERARAELRGRGVQTFPGLLRDARDLLGRDPALCARVRRRIDQLLVDEFQDTDRLQCEIVASLALEGPSRERPGLFVVGDPKQSIYGWRDAELAAYDDFVERIAAAGGERRSLVVSFRSVPPILAEVERVIAPVMQPRRGVQPPFEALLPAPERREAPGFRGGRCAPVEHWVSWTWDGAGGEPPKTRSAEAAALEARALAADVARVHQQGVPWKEIGLLFRGVGDLETYLAELRRAGVPFVVEGDRSYFQRREIIEAAALVRCVLDPNDQVALLAFLRSAAVGVPDAALIPLWSGGLPARAAALDGPDPRALAELRAGVAEAVRQVPADVPGIERVAGWEENLLQGLAALAALRASFEEEPADVFVEKLRGLLLVEAGEAARYLGGYRVANLERFFRDLLVALRDGEGDPRAILRAMRQDVAERREAEEGRPKEAAEDAVQVLTIHKAKGLAFSHVYVLQLNKRPGGRHEARPEERPDGRFEYELLGVPTPGYVAVRARREAVEAAERVRTLYVALTRARERLVVAGLWPQRAERPSPESHVALLERRQGGAPDLPALMDELAAAGGCQRDAAGARWVFPGLPAFPAAVGEPGLAGARLFEPAAVAAASAALARAREGAAARMGRARGAALSAQSHEASLEAWREGGIADDPEAEGRPRAAARGDGGVARAVGTAIHRALERLDPAAPAAEELARRRGELRDELLRELAGEAAEAALARAEALLERFFAGPLHARLRALGPHLVARELAVLLPADGGGDARAPAGYLVGRIDLLYRDPHSGEWVVADYKTDRVASGAELRARAADYAAQGGGYLRAVREALRLPRAPRFELWFLEAGEIHALEAAAGPS